jgi:Mg2+ and Co2+ transporter CorA
MKQELLFLRRWAWVLMVAVTGGMVYYFRKKRWL